MLEFLGFILPPLIDTVNRKVSDETIRFWIAFAISSVFGFAFHLVEGGLINDYNGIAQSILVVFGTTQIAYKGFYEDSSIQKTIRG